jgi:superfamily II DNA helicase RecQ
MQLRPYQTQLVTEIRGQYQLGHKAVLAVLPTGGGKTVCFSIHRPSGKRQGQPGAHPGPPR